MKVSAGGNYFTEGCINKPDFINSAPKPWDKSETVQMKPFWEARDDWIPTWRRDTDASHMIVDYLKVWCYPEWDPDQCKNAVRY